MPQNHPHNHAKTHLTYHGVGCFRNRQKSFKPEQFCFGDKEYEANIWGCKRLSMPINEWGGGWLDYGQFDKAGVWCIDKPRIRHEIELGLKENELCPVLDRRRVLETIDNLPNTIDPKRNKNWQYRTSYEEIDGEYREVAVGIRPFINKINRYVVGKYKPCWEPETSGSVPTNEHTTEVNEESTPSTKASRKKSSSVKASGSYSWVVWFILIVMVLYFVGSNNAP